MDKVIEIEDVELWANTYKKEVEKIALQAMQMAEEKIFGIKRKQCK